MLFGLSPIRPRLLVEGNFLLSSADDARIITLAQYEGFAFRGIQWEFFLDRTGDRK